jgi:tetratricopeptide (TPR) repeat protein
MAAAERAWKQALFFAEQGDYAAERAESIGWLLHSTIFGPLPAVEGIARAREFQELAGDDPTIEAWCCVERSVLEAMRGEFDLARKLLEDGTRALTELGLNVWAANTAQEAFLIANLAGAPEAATDVLRTSYATLDQMGERAFSSTIAGFLAQAVYAQGDYDEAGRFSRASEMAAAPDDVVSQMLWRTSRAKILARHGELERAEVLAREAVQLGEPTDLVNTRADALFDLAEVLALAERRDDALAALQEAERLYEAKGNLMALERARSVALELAVPSASA